MSLAFKVGLEGRGVHSRRHQDHAQLRAFLQQSSQKDQQEVRVQAPLVHLHMSKHVGKPRIPFSPLSPPTGSISEE